MEHYELIIDFLKDSNLKVSHWSYHDETIVWVRRPDHTMASLAQLTFSKNEPEFLFACGKSWMSCNLHTTDFDQLVHKIKAELDDYQKQLDEEFGKL